METTSERTKLSTAKLKELRIGLVYLFGSHAEGVSGHLSDVDVGIVFSDPKIVKGNTMEVYGQLYDLLSDTFGTSNLDIVFLERATLELRFDVITHGRVLFETSPDFRFGFESRTAMLYADFKPLLNNFNRAVLDRISP